MASINLSGVLRNPDTTLASGGEVRLIHRSNTGEVVAGFRETLNVNNDGTYDFNIQYGNVFIQTRDMGVNQWTDHGTLTINQDTSATTLPELLNAAVPPTEPLLIELQDLLADAKAAADRAEAAGERSIKVYPTLADIQADSSLEAGKVVTNFQAKLDYYVSENQEAGGVPITGTSPQLYANPQQTTPGTGETNTASNIGDGEGTFAQKVSSDLQFRTQVSQYGLESHLLGDTYYRGLNPFIADNIGAFAGGMVTTRVSSSTLINRSGVVETVGVDRPAYGAEGLSCFESFTNKITNPSELSSSNGNLIASGFGAGSKPTVTEDYSEAPDLSNRATRVQMSLNGGVTTSDRSEVQLIYPVNLGGDDTASIWVKSSDFSNYDIRFDFNGASPDIGPLHVNVTPQWKRISFSKKNVNSTVQRLFIRLRGDQGTSDSADILIWGAQVSNGLINYPYQDGGSSQGVRATESHYISMNGNCPSCNGDFTFVLDSKSRADGSGSFFLSSTNFRFGRALNDRIVATIIKPDGTAINALTSSGIFDDELVRMAVRKRDDLISIFINGTSVASVTAENFDWQASSNMYIGTLDGSLYHINDYIKIKKWLVNESLTDDQILELGGPDNVIL